MAGMSLKECPSCDDMAMVLSCALWKPAGQAPILTDSETSR